MQIHKYPLEECCGQTVELPKGYIIRDIAYYGGRLFLWAEIDPHVSITEGVDIQMLGTGHEIPKGYTYFKTIQDGRFIWHFYI